MKAVANLMLVAVGIAVIGCGGPPRNNPLLDDARISVRAASNDSAVVTGAPAALDRAETTLRRGERLLREGGDRADVEHYAYLTQQHVAIAEAVARLRAGEEEIKRAEVERQQILLQARESEAVRARSEAEAERREAELAREQAEAALRRAQELDQRVQELEARQTERGLVLTLSEVLFDVGRATLKPGSQRAVEQLAQFLKESPERRVLVEGHTDNTGSLQLNLDLSRRRADAVKAALMGMGIPETSISTVGHGPAYPVAGNNTAAGRQQNRRVEIVISDHQGRIPERQ